MILLIDTSERVARVAVVANEQFLAVQECGSGPDLGKKIIEAADALLTAKSLTWESITRIAVHRGKVGSSFMALRVGIVTATMLAESLNRELVAVAGELPLDIITQASQAAAIEVVEPFYASLRKVPDSIDNS